MQIENFIKIENSNATAAGQQANKASGEDFLASLLLAAAGAENDQQAGGKIPVKTSNSGQQSVAEQDQPMLDAEALLCQLLGITATGQLPTDKGHLTLSPEMVNQLATLLEKVGNGQRVNLSNLNEQQLKMLAHLLNSAALVKGENADKLAQMLSQVENSAGSLPPPMEKLLQQLTQPNHQTQQHAGKLAGQSHEKAASELPVANTKVTASQQTGEALLSNGQNNGQQKSDQQGQQPLWAQVSKLMQQAQSQRGNLGHQPVQQVTVQNAEHNNSINFTLPDKGLTPEIKLDGAVQPEQLGQRLVNMLKEMSVRQQPNQTTMHLKLKPAHLGDVTVRLTYNRGELNAQFYVNTGHGKEALEAALPQLRDTLLQYQVKLNETSVFLSNDDSNWLGRQRHQDGYQSGGRAKAYQQRTGGEIKINNVLATAEEQNVEQQGLDLLV